MDREEAKTAAEMVATHPDRVQLEQEAVERFMELGSEIVGLTMEANGDRLHDAYLAHLESVGGALYALKEFQLMMGEVAIARGIPDAADSNANLSRNSLNLMKVTKAMQLSHAELLAATAVVLSMLASDAVAAAEVAKRLAQKGKDH